MCILDFDAFCMLMFLLFACLSERTNGKKLILIFHIYITASLSVSIRSYVLSFGLFKCTAYIHLDVLHGGNFRY